MRVSPFAPFSGHIQHLFLFEGSGHFFFFFKGRYDFFLFLFLARPSPDFFETRRRCRSPRGSESAILSLPRRNRLPPPVGRVGLFYAPLTQMYELLLGIVLLPPPSRCTIFPFSFLWRRRRSFSTSGAEVYHRCSFWRPIRRKPSFFPLFHEGLFFRSLL